jgi:hypothetical protein
VIAPVGAAGCDGTGVTDVDDETELGAAADDAAGETPPVAIDATKSGTVDGAFNTGAATGLEGADIGGVGDSAPGTGEGVALTAAGGGGTLIGAGSDAAKGGTETGAVETGG